MAQKVSREKYASIFGPTTGDRVRLADTELFAEVEDKPSLIVATKADLWDQELPKWKDSIQSRWIPFSVHQAETLEELEEALYHNSISENVPSLEEPWLTNLRQQAAAEKMPTKLPKAPPKRANKMAQQNELVKKRTDALTGVMQNLAKARALNEDAEKKRREQERKIAADKLNDSLSAAAGDVLKAPEKPVIGPLGLSDIDRLRAHLSKCWDPPIGAAGSDTLIVDIIVTLDRDGRVLSAKVDNKLRFNTDRIFQVAAEEAIRATRECSPLPLPPEKYFCIRL